MEKFTKGKWEVAINKNWRNDNCICKMSDDTAVVTDVYTYSGSIDADAHLIAAAPEMYRLISDLSAFNCPFEYMTPDEMIAFTKIEKLLAKARGEK